MASWLFVRLVLFFLISSPRLQEKNVRGKMVLLAVEAVPAGSKPPAAVSMHISTGERRSFGTQRLCRPRRHPFERQPDIRLSSRSWSNSSSRQRPFLHNRYSHVLLDLLQRPPHACESSCQLVRLPPWHDVAAEHHALGLFNADLSLSTSCQ